MDYLIYCFYCYNTWLNKANSAYWSIMLCFTYLTFVLFGCAVLLLGFALGKDVVHYKLYWAVGSMLLSALVFWKLFPRNMVDEIVAKYKEKLGPKRFPHGLLGYALVIGSILIGMQVIFMK